MNPDEEDRWDKAQVDAFYTPLNRIVNPWTTLF